MRIEERMGREVGATAMHVSSGAFVPPAERGITEYGTCCMGAAMFGRNRCTCWEPIYDLEQQPLADGGAPPAEIPTRAKCCHDCAYRNGSPEREDGDTDWLLEIAASGGQREFWCHQGMRRVVAFQHPDGRILPAGEGDYRPPVGPEHRPVAWKADGTIAERCAGWAAHASAALPDTLDPAAELEAVDAVGASNAEPPEDAADAGGTVELGTRSHPSAAADDLADGRAVGAHAVDEQVGAAARHGGGGTGDVVAARLPRARDRATARLVGAGRRPPRSIRAQQQHENERPQDAPTSEEPR
jgi:hypothetical protein